MRIERGRKGGCCAHGVNVVAHRHGIVADACVPLEDQLSPIVLPMDSQRASGMEGALATIATINSRQPAAHQNVERRAATTHKPVAGASVVDLIPRHQPVATADRPAAMEDGPCAPQVTVAHLEVLAAAQRCFQKT